MRQTRRGVTVQGAYQAGAWRGGERRSQGAQWGQAEECPEGGKGRQQRGVTRGRKGKGGPGVRVTVQGAHEACAGRPIKGGGKKRRGRERRRVRGGAQRERGKGV